MKNINTLSPCYELSKVRLLSCDVDGVLTDGGLYYDEQGKELRKFHVHDGLGIQNLQKAGIPVCIISRSSTKAIEARAYALGIGYCFTGVKDKLECLKSIIEDLKIDYNQVAHVGDDINDCELLNAVGFPITVSNALPEVQSMCRYVTSKSGGNGAIREISDVLLASLKNYSQGPMNE